MFADLQQIETKIANTWAEANQLAFFNNDVDEMVDSTDRRQKHLERRLGHQLIVADLQKARDVWNQKMDLHIALANKYLDIIQFDYAYAEKKSLDNLCWKRAIYSLVEQFRQSLKVRIKTKLDGGEDEEEEEKQEKDEDVDIEIPVISETGMTMVALSPSDDEDDEADDYNTKHHAVSKADEIVMLKQCFNKFLDLADDFYRRSMVTLHAMDETEAFTRQEDRQHSLDASTQDHLQEWRRTRRLKWYKGVPNRGDLARYRWACCSKDRQLAFDEAWRWYAVGAWLMPATGKLYFHLSLLMSDSSHKDNTRQDLHRFYFSTRSLMVRRNGFLNAREGMIVLFESNRRWVDKYLNSFQAARANAKRMKRNKQTQQQPQQMDDTVPAQDVVAGLFVRLHGMMFTKIGLDQFAHIKRRFFEALFPPKLEQEGRPDSESSFIENGRFREGALSGQQMFWFEAIVLCLSSLYNYEYSASKLNRLMILYGKQLFPPKSDNGAPSSTTTSSSSSPPPLADYQGLLDEFKESVLFAYDIDLMCQIATELFRRYIKPSLSRPAPPSLPLLPRSPLSLEKNREFLFEARDPSLASATTTRGSADNEDDESWLVYIEMLLHWMVVNCVCMRPHQGISLWESIVGNVSTTTTTTTTSATEQDSKKDESKINPAFWTLLLQFFNKLLFSLPEDTKYELVNRHLLDEEEHQHQDDACMSEMAFAQLMSKVLGEKPDLPEEDHMRGLGWVDDVTGRLLKMNVNCQNKQVPLQDQVTRRKLKILDYAFALVKQMHHVLYYDPVLEVFASKAVEDKQALVYMAEEGVSLDTTPAATDSAGEVGDEGEGMSTTLQAMDDAVLFSNENDSVDEDGDDDMLTQLKKRRELLQAMVTTTTAEDNRTGYRRAPARVKEREARLNRLRKRVIPGRTTIILDTNCFIGHFEHVKRLIKSSKWTIVIPLVVITELDGLRSNTPPLGSIAGNALKFIESTLATKQRTGTSLRIQTSHNNFMHDIAIRSEQFVFGESDKNLDDLVLSACLWWATKGDDNSHTRVCLVTGDRNLSVKARARDIDVMSVSAIMQLTPR
ncbi:PIN domain-containing protein [Zychaea mexicana]|uniref:PIN domain-containing protein n=1 Tax=Zychaea mexicana TaxID=64656 RepID=UPI0022FE1388|nr:PIN domain-containing protein [Zychaea mexicana]KAI9499424.1 PIN domain-containing protein [Zychaea mexicana]